MRVIRPHTYTIESSNVPEDDAPAYNAGTTYALGAQVIYQHNVYESAQAENTGNTPGLSPDWWFLVGATNQRKMFDIYLNTRTEYLELIDVKLGVQRTDFISLFGLEGNTVNIKLWNDAETELLWEREIDLVYGTSTVEISDWYEYFFGEYSFKEDVSTSIGVITFSGVLQITITAATGTNAACGNFVLGRQHNIGKTQYGATVGFLDYSRKSANEFGQIFLKQGNFAKVNSYSIIVENLNVDPVFRLLASLRGTATAWVGDDRDESGFESLLVYGFFRDFSIVIGNPTISECRLEIEGIA